MDPMSRKRWIYNCQWPLKVPRSWKSGKVVRFSFSSGTQVMETQGSTVRYLQEAPLSLLIRSETTSLLGILLLYGHLGRWWGSVDILYILLTRVISKSLDDYNQLCNGHHLWNCHNGHWQYYNLLGIKNFTFSDVGQSCHNRHCSHCWCKWHPLRKTVSSFGQRFLTSFRNPLTIFHQSENNLIQNESWINDKKKIGGLEGIEGLTCFGKQNPRQTKSSRQRATLGSKKLAGQDSLIQAC